MQALDALLLLDRLEREADIESEFAEQRGEFLVEHIVFPGIERKQRPWLPLDLEGQRRRRPQFEDAGARAPGLVAFVNGKALDRHRRPAAPGRAGRSLPFRPVGVARDDDLVEIPDRAARGDNLKAGGLVRHTDPSERHFAAARGNATDFGIKGRLIWPARGDLVDLGEHGVKLRQTLQAPILASLQGLLTRGLQDVASDGRDVFEPNLRAGIGQAAFAAGQREGADQTIPLQDRIAPARADVEISRHSGEIGPAGIVLGIVDIGRAVVESGHPARAGTTPGGQAIKRGDHAGRGTRGGENAEPAVLAHRHDARDPSRDMVFCKMADPDGEKISRKPSRQIPEDRGLNPEQVECARFVEAGRGHGWPKECFIAFDT